MENHCLHCEQAFVGRSDKKFCSHQCRSAWHQLRKQQESQGVQQISKRLSHNRSLIKRLLAAGHTKTGMEHLLDLGFDACYFTHIYKTQGGNIYFFCFDAGYRLLPNNRLLLVNWQDYMLPQSNFDRFK